MKTYYNESEHMLTMQALKKQLGETKLKIALLEAALKEAEALSLENEKSAEMAPNPSTIAAIHHELNRLTRRKRLRFLPRVLRVAVALLLITFISLGTALAVSSDVRVMVMKLLYRVTPQYTEISLVPDEATFFNVPAQWGGEYYPSYIPEGYRFYGAYGVQSMQDVVYIADNDRTLIFSENDANVEANIDTEGYEISEVEINGQKAMLAYNGEKSTIVWNQNDKILLITVTELPEVVIKIAQSVIKIK